MVAFAGIEPWPQITSVLPRLASCRISGTSPPGPQRCGSITCKVKAVATAASKAFPPRSRMPMPTAVAIQCVLVTTPKVPTISGRVVKGLGLINFMGQASSGTKTNPKLRPTSSCVPAPFQLPPHMGKAMLQGRGGILDVQGLSRGGNVAHGRHCKLAFAVGDLAEAVDH